MKVEVEGQRELIKSLRAVDRDLPRELTGLHRELVEPLVPEAAGRAPQRSGRLADSIRAQSGQKYGRIAAGGARIPYAGPIHFGWPGHNIESHPFLTDTLESNSEQTADRYLELIDQFLDRVWRSI